MMMMMMMMMMILGPFLIGCCYFEVPLDIFQVGQRISLLLQHKVWWLWWAQGKGLWLVDTYCRAGGVNLLFVFRSDSPGHSVQGKGKSSKGKGKSKSKCDGYEVCSSSGGGEGCCDGHLLVCFFFVCRTLEEETWKEPRRSPEREKWNSWPAQWEDQKLCIATFISFILRSCNPGSTIRYSYIAPQGLKNWSKIRSQVLRKKKLRLGRPPKTESHFLGIHWNSNWAMKKGPLLG